MQLICIEKTYSICQKVSFGDMKSKILPRMLMLCSDPDNRVKKRALQFVKERIDIMDASLVQSQVFSIIEGNMSQANPPSVNFLILDLMEHLSKSYDIEIIASKILPILISFLINKSSSKEEFERYYESINKSLALIKEKRFADFHANPHKPKAEEPEEFKSNIVPLQELIQTSKIEGFDVLFSKKQEAPQMPTAMPNTDWSKPSVGNTMPQTQGSLPQSFGEFNSFPTAPTQPKQFLPPQTGLARPPQKQSNDTGFEFNFGGMGEGLQTGFGGSNTQSLGGGPQFGGTSMGGGQKMPQGGFNFGGQSNGTTKPAASGKSLYDAFDDFTLVSLHLYGRTAMTMEASAAAH